MKKSLFILLALSFSLTAFAQDSNFALTADRYTVDCATNSERSRVFFTFTDSELGVVMEDLMFSIDEATAHTETYYFFGKDRIFLKYPNNKFAYLKSSTIERSLGLININFTDLFKQLKTETPFTFVSEPNFDDVTLKDGSTFVGKVKNPYNPKGRATTNLLISMNCSLKLQERIVVQYPSMYLK